MRKDEKNGEDKKFSIEKTLEGTVVNVMAAERIVKCLKNHKEKSSSSSSFLNYSVLYKEEVDSTNLWAKKLARAGAPEGTAVFADMQTAGMGRRGRSWASGGGHSIYMSLVLRPDIAPEQASMLTLVMGLAVTQICRKMLHLDAKIKWPNDMVISGKKVCGILTEMGMKGTGIDYVIAGIGINVNATEFPEEIRKTATSLAIEAGRVLEREEIVAAVLEQISINYKKFLETGDLTNLVKEYNEVLVNREREIRVLDPKGEYRAIATGINEKGELLVTKEDGTRVAVYAGEVSVRGIYGYV